MSPLSYAAQCIKGNCISGAGTSVEKHGIKYVGQWSNAKKHGQGILTYASGNKYIGKWKYDKKHGQGTLTYSSGSKYIG